MPPRRSHKKSKAGCVRCKQRKIKCDEVHPRCGNCIKHAVSCDFSEPLSPGTGANSPSVFTTFSNTPSPSTSTSSPTLQSPILSQIYRAPTDLLRAQVNPAATRSLELKLMHHYTAITAITFSDTHSSDSAWQIDVPTIAHDAQYLMDAILAVAALHLRYLNPADQSVVRASHGYMASALAQYSSLLRNGVSEVNAEALFCTAALIAFQASASRGFDDSEGSYSLPLAWFHSFQGIRTVVMTSWPWLRSSARIHPIISGQPAVCLDMENSRKDFFAPLLDGMEEQIASEPDNCRDLTRQAYVQAVSYLNWAHKKPERGRILGFAACVSRRYVELISEHDPRVLVITSCFFALTRAVDDAWWLRGLAKREVSGMFNLLPQDWWPKMEWPMKIANHEGPIDDRIWGVPRFAVDIKEEIDVMTHIDMIAEIMGQAPPPD